MIFQPYYLGCLAHASYLVIDGDRAVVVDPQRDVDAYLRDAEAHGARITDVIETHLHADFVSGHHELAARTGARIWLGEGSGASFAHEVASDGRELRLGRATLRFLATPGHTIESVSVLVRAPGEPDRLLTGDTLFIGDVGRPDLVASRGKSAAEMARMMYASLRDKIAPLSDATEVWPAHGAGSACGRYIADARTATLGAQRRDNWALAPMGEAEFVERMLTDLPPVPAYFAFDVAQNRSGAPALPDVTTVAALDPAAVEAAVAGGALVLDVRDALAYAAGHVPGSIHVSLGGNFAPFVGLVVPSGARLVVVADDADGLAEATLRLARIGYDQLAGHLAGGVDAWAASGRPLARHERIDVDALAVRLAGPGPAPVVLDVRRPGETARGHIAGAHLLPLAQLAAGGRPALPPGTPLHVICGSGYRSPIAISLLERAGYSSLVDVAGGMGAWDERLRDRAATAARSAETSATSPSR